MVFNFHGLKMTHGGEVHSTPRSIGQHILKSLIELFNQLCLKCLVFPRSTNTSQAVKFSLEILERHGTLGCSLVGGGEAAPVGLCRRDLAPLRQTPAG